MIETLFLRGEILILLCVDHDHFCKAHYRLKPETFKELKYFAYTQVPNVACLLYSRMQKLNCTEKIQTLLVKWSQWGWVFNPFMDGPWCLFLQNRFFTWWCMPKQNQRTLSRIQNLCLVQLLFSTYKTWVISFIDQIFHVLT